jgi:hypothetical protein
MAGEGRSAEENDHGGGGDYTFHHGNLRRITAKLSFHVVNSLTALLFQPAADDTAIICCAAVHNPYNH